MRRSPMTAFVLAVILITSTRIFSVQLPRAELNPEYDTSKVVTLKGRINGLDALGAAASLLLLNGSGREDSWAIEGDAHQSLVAAGWFDAAGNRTVRSNTEASVTVWLPRPHSPAQSRLMGLIDTTLTTTIARRVFGSFVDKGQFAYGLDVSLADGRTLSFGHRRADGSALIR